MYLKDLDLLINIEVCTHTMDEKWNILRIDKKIKENFSNEQKDLSRLEQELEDISTTLDNPNDLGYKDTVELEEKRVLLTNKLNDIKHQISLSYYLQESVFLLDKYVDMLRKPIKISFMGKKKKINNEPKRKIVVSYLKVARKYSGEDLFFGPDEKDDMLCENCGKSDLEGIDERVFICMNCGAQKEYLYNSSSYNDIDRVNTSSTYKYDRKTHFKDKIYQYQGKQNSTIKPKVYEDIIEQCKLNRLLDGDENTPKLERFRRVTKTHVHNFLRQTDHTKHYEDTTLIHHNLTGQPTPDISMHEKDLIDDHDKLLKVYPMVKEEDRQNFLNADYILLELLIKRKIPCDENDFNTLKTDDRLSYHNDKCEKMFDILEWNFTKIS